MEPSDYKSTILNVLEDFRTTRSTPVKMGPNIFYGEGLQGRRWGARVPGPCVETQLKVLI
jgi:hypothetical protein